MTIKTISIFPVAAGQNLFPLIYGQKTTRKKSRPLPERIGRGRGRTPRIAGFVPILFQKSWNKVFPCSWDSSSASLNLVPTPFFKLEQSFSRVHGLLGAFVPIVPVFNKSSIYKHLYRDPFPYSFFRALGLKIIGTNGTFTGNAHHYGKKYVPTPILRIGTTGTNGTFSGKNPHKWA
ncbi:MAG: hypothetical protein MSC45_00780 [Mobiluncus sp.]|jgi:hypothetical protein|uniref:hypothetical protein n=1 Tax=Mobiluncus sp. TaxID=47293 RepID=UPI0025896309|nr:hypothetical protein [Mobiluncus sp.]MCI6583589.1 hypothetical protein [Mobiluncus sp.]